MKDEDTIYDNECTQYSGSDEETVVDIKKQEVTKDNAATEKVAAKSSKTSWKTVAVGGVSGIVLGAAGALFTSGITEEVATESEEEAADSSDHPSYLDDDISFASGVSDDMSFGEAFAAARAEVGPGGVFEWHGYIYGTYTEDEWNSMTADEKAEYASHIHWDGGSPENAEPLDMSDPTQDHVEYYAGREAGPHEHVDYDEPEVIEVVDDSEDSEVEILGVEHVYDDDGNEMVFGSMVIDGEDVVLVDVDGGDFDYAFIDANHNQEIDNGEVYDVSDMHLSVDNVEEQYMEQEGMDGFLLADNDMPDYVNDADGFDYVQK